MPTPRSSSTEQEDRSYFTFEARCDGSFVEVRAMDDDSIRPKFYFVRSELENALALFQDREFRRI
jgi:hypothetical protein